MVHAEFPNADGENFLPAKIMDPFNRAEERALINLVPPALGERILKAYRNRPELFGLDEKALIKSFTDYGERGPGPLSNAIRMKFWYEYDEAQNHRRRMKIQNIMAGICDEMAFYKTFDHPEKVAWVLTQPVRYDAATEEMHQFALSRVRRTLEADPFNEATGKVDTKLAEVQLKIFQMLDTRIKGAVVQKTMNVHASLPDKKNLTEAARHEELENRIKAIERLNEKQIGQIVDARIVEAEQTEAKPETDI